MHNRSKMMKFKLVTSLWLALLCTIGATADETENPLTVWALAPSDANPTCHVPKGGIGNGLIGMTFDPSTGLGEVTTAWGCRYRQIPGENYLQSVTQARVRILSTSRAVISAEFQGTTFTQTVEMAADTPSFRITVSGPTGFTIAKPVDRPPFPTLFAAPGEGYEWALTEGQGLLMCADDPDMPVDESTGMPLTEFALPVYSGFGLRQAWVGLSHPGRGTGYGVIFEEPWSLGIDFNIWKQSEKKYLIASTRIGGYLQTFSVPRSFQFFFQKDGGYVSLAKTFREYAKKAGLYRSFSDKIKENPEVAKLAGAADVWIYRRPWNSRTDDQVVEALTDFKTRGLSGAVVHINDINHPFSRENVEKLKGMGFLTGRYDNYSDIVTNHPVQEYWKDMADAARDPLGKMASQGNNLDANSRYKLTPSAILPWAEKFVPGDIAQYGWSARFIDVLGGSAVFTYEDFNPERKANAVDVYRYRREFFRYLQELKNVVGTEQGCGWANPYIHYSEGALGHRKWLEKSKETDDGREIRVGWKPDFTPGTNYRKFSMNHTRRVPLSPLVYGDAQLDTYHWSDGNVRIPEFALVKDLFCILYGMPPMYVFTPDYYFEKRDDYVASAKRVLPAIEKVFGSEMIDHRWLTEDRAVQETTWKNGWHVIVNFSDKPYLCTSGNNLPAMDFIMFKK